eukprot:184223-Ditylum_brightwellii.AAC.2
MDYTRYAPHHRYSIGTDCHYGAISSALSLQDGAALGETLFLSPLFEPCSKEFYTLVNAQDCNITSKNWTLWMIQMQLCHPKEDREM